MSRPLISPSLEDLVKFPFVVKQDMRDAYPFGLFARSQRDVVHASSGTTARRPSSAQRQTISRTGATASLAVSTWSAARRIHAIQVAYGFGLFTGGLGAHQGGGRSAAPSSPSSGNTKRQVQMMKDLGTDIPRLHALYALLIADTAIEMGYDPAKDFKISGGIFGAEPASDNMRKEIAEKLGITYCDVYGLSRSWDRVLRCSAPRATVFTSPRITSTARSSIPSRLSPCPKASGASSSSPRSRASAARSFATAPAISRALFRALLLRARHRRIDKLRGRTDDMLIIRGVNVFPSQIEQVITEFRRSPRIIRSSSPRAGRLITSSFRLKPSPTSPSTRSARSSRLKRLSAELKEQPADRG